MSAGLFHSLLSMSAIAGDLYVSLNGSGAESGVDAANAMSLSDFINYNISNDQTILFNKGDTFEFGDYDITSSNNIFDAYGSGADPIFTGSTDISGLTWTSLGGGVYSTPMATNPKWIWISGLCAKMASTARITINSRPSTTQISITHATVSGYTSIVGSLLVAKVKNYQNSQAVTVTAYNGAGVITIDQAIDDSGNVDLVLLNYTEYFSGNSEWVWRSDTLYVKAAASPSTLDIRAGAYDYAFKATNTTGVATFQNIEFAEYWQFGIHTLDTDVVIDVNSCDFHDIRDSAVSIKRFADGVNVSDNNFERIGAAGIFMSPGDNGTFNNNTFTNIGMQQNYGWPTWAYNTGAYVIRNCAITVAAVDIDNPTVIGNANQFNYNVVTNVAYSGIQARSSNDQIKYNRVTDFMGRFDDGGGLYTYHYGAYNQLSEDIEISNNIVSNNNNPSQGVGIYCDNQTFAASVHHNVIYNCGWGIMLNDGTSDHTVEDNIVWDCGYGVQFSKGGSFFLSTNVNNQFNRNILAVTSTTDRLLRLIEGGTPTSWNPFSGSGGSDQNSYINPSSSNIAFRTTSGDLTLAGLQALTGTDAASVKRSGTYSQIINTDQSTALTGDFYSAKFVAASTQGIDLGTEAAIQFTNASTYTIALRFYSPPTSTNNKVILGNFNAGARGIRITLVSDGTIEVRIANVSATNRLVLITPDTYDDRGLHTLVLVYTGTPANTKLYIDDVDVTNIITNNLSATTASTGNWTIGYNKPTSALYYDGNVLDVAIWGSDQTANKSLIYNNGLPFDIATLASPPLHYWRIRPGANDAAKYVDTGTSGSLLTGAGVNTPVITGMFYNPLDLAAIEAYSIDPVYGLLYLKSAT